MKVFFEKGSQRKKNELIKSVFQNYLNPAFNLQKGLANKDYQESKSHNNFTSNSHNEKLNNSKSETSNCTDDVQINNRQSCDHVKLCQPESESSNCPSKNDSMEMKITMLLIAIIKKRKQDTKQNLRNHLKKTKGKTRIYTWRQHFKTREWL